MSIRNKSRSSAAARRLYLGAIGAVTLIAILAYGAFAATQHAGSWTVFVRAGGATQVKDGSQTENVKINGNENLIDGDIKSNLDTLISGNSNIFGGLFHYWDDASVGGTGNSYQPSQPLGNQAPTDWPGTLAGSFTEPACDFGTRTTHTDLDLPENAAPGVYCRGNAKVTIKDAGNFVGQFTILTNGEINVGDQDVDLIPDTDGILFYSASNLIHWSGNLGSASGLWHARGGEIRISGNENDFCSQFAASTMFQLSGNENTINECLAPTPSPSPTPAQLTVTTAVHNSAHEDVTNGSVPLGSIVHDTADLSGVVDGKTPPAITFSLYETIDCSGPATAVTNTGPGEGADAVSATVGPLGAGSYSFKAAVGSNTDYIGDDSDCEPFTVNQAQLSVTTAVHDSSHADVTNSSVPLGSTVHDTANLSGDVDGFSVPTIEFTFYANGTCSGDGTPVTNTGAGDGADAVSANVGPLNAAGGYSFKASIPGNTNYLGDDSDCEPFTVGVAQLTLTTEVHDPDHNDITNGSAPLGTIVHDIAILSGVIDGVTPPAISFELHEGLTCEDPTPTAVANNGTEGDDTRSANVGPLPAGDYSFLASVGSNDNYTGDDAPCEPFTINKAQLSVTTAVHNAAHADVTNSSVALGSSVHDTAQLSGDVSGFATPTIEFTFYENGTCTGDGVAVANTGAGDGADAVSATVGPLGAGSYAFSASIAGNDNYLGDDSDCEPFTVNQAQLSVTTAVHNAAHSNVTFGSVALGSSVHDTAQLSGDVSGFATPTIEFTFYENGTCTGDGVAVANTGAGDGADAVSATVGPLGAGSYSFSASIDGNDNYLGDDSDCEPFTVNQAQLSVTTAVHDESHSDITNSSAPLGTTVHDTAQLSGDVSGFATPAIEFTFYLNGTCTGDGQAITNTGSGDGADAVSGTVGPLGAGSYSFSASIDGNDDYLGDDSDCEPFTINQAQLSVTTAVHDESHSDVTNTIIPLNSTVHDTANLSGEVSGFSTPTIEFTFYLNATCTGDGQSVNNNGAGDGADAVSDLVGPLAAGAYSFKASIDGNDNYIGDDSDCEPFGVGQVQLSVTTAVHDAAHNDVTFQLIPFGSVVHDTANLSGVVDGVTPPAITFTFYQSIDCTGDGQPVTNLGPGEGADAVSADVGPLGFGAFSFKAAVAGDANYLGDDSDCEPFTVLPDTSSWPLVPVLENPAQAGINGLLMLGGALVLWFVIRPIRRRERRPA